jgi:hypothetical protein
MAVEKRDYIEHLETMARSTKVLGGAKIEIIKDDDWSMFDGDDIKWVDGTDAVQFCGYGGPVVYIAHKDVEYPTILGKRTRQSVVYVVLRPDSWTEYGQVQVDYEIEAISSSASMACAEVAKLIAYDQCSGWEESISMNDFFEENWE